MPVVVEPQPPEALTASVTTRLTPTEKAALSAKATALGTSMSALMRHWVQEGLR